MTATDDDAKALAQAVLARMDRIQNMATSDEPSEALQTLEKRATELETALADTQQRLNDESTARANAERRAGREASSRADMEVEVARLKENLRSLKSAKNLEVLAEAARLEARAEDADKRAELLRGRYTKPAEAEAWGGWRGPVFLPRKRGNGPTPRRNARKLPKIDVGWLWSQPSKKLH